MVAPSAPMAEHKESIDPEIAREMRRNKDIAEQADRLILSLTADNERLTAEVERLNGELRVANETRVVERVSTKIEHPYNPVAQEAGSTRTVPTPASQLPHVDPAKILPTGIAKQIRYEAEQHWKTNYQMVNYQIDEQVEAYWKIQSHKRDTRSWVRAIISEAEAHWKTNYQMVNYQIEEQTAAKLKLDSRR